MIAFVAGYFCGEIDIPKTIISETPFVRLLFHADRYDERSQFKFSSEMLNRDERWSKLGPIHKIRGRRGQQVSQSYCDKIFQDCTPGHCYIHSPGYPEIYPRNLKCR